MTNTKFVLDVKLSLDCSRPPSSYIYSQGNPQIIFYITRYHHSHNCALLDSLSNAAIQTTTFAIGRTHQLLFDKNDLRFILIEMAIRATWTTWTTFSQMYCPFNIVFICVLFASKQQVSRRTSRVRDAETCWCFYLLKVDSPVVCYMRLRRYSLYMAIACDAKAATHRVAW